MSTTTAPSVPGVDPSPGETASVRTARARSAEVEALIAHDPRRFRVLTGDRPTGPLHLGHLVGTVENRVRLQDAGVDVVVVVADYQVITDRDDPGDLPAAVRDVVLDQLAAGLDPARSTIFAHSAVPALHQLLLPFLALVTVAELERNPTVKAEAVDAARRQGRGMSGLLLTYPVHQAADILAVHGNLVPVGTDQLPHLETTRTVARRFNQRFTAAQPYFAEPDALLTDTPTILGNDGEKMSKSRGNVLELRASDDATAAYFRRARTDGDRHITFDPEQRPEVANLLRLGAHFAGTTPQDLAESVGSAGAGRLKEVVTDAVVEGLRPLRARRRDLAADAPAVVADALGRGAARVNAIADATLQDVRELMRTVY
ncbi:tryptophan--tRNA ligase [Isoptericola dokdonensis]|uniref:Tryptophan--tRNA ligase n=1 Tax=Isoptericola dokdonensis DS-3 TaxID=1300344 RepID=A0A168FC31_9MICO|nr:tryptophan--tRNA ligase [Isoptericola dokdonensis]ANC31321.1 Tryptophan--tRNA ligase 2 [Isoptericola dokdonensis DS-3]